MQKLLIALGAVAVLTSAAAAQVGGTPLVLSPRITDPFVIEQHQQARDPEARQFGLSPVQLERAPAAEQRFTPRTLSPRITDPFAVEQRDRAWN